MFDSPRFWLLIQSLNLAHIKVDEGDDPLLLFNCLSNTLKKLRNLVALVITVDSLRVKWCTCGDLFEGSTFQLRIYGSGFILDRDHTAFLTHQPLILDWNWMPGPGSTHRLPSETMPNLTVLTTGSFVPELREIITGRPITHIDVGGRVITNISELATGSLPLKVLLMFCWDRSTPRSICRFFPSLKRFGWLSYGSQLDVSASCSTQVFILLISCFRKTLFCLKSFLDYAAYICWKLYPRVMI
jgi:hypothetical protein